MAAAPGVGVGSCAPAARGQRSPGAAAQPSPRPWSPAWLFQGRWHTHSTATPHAEPSLHTKCRRPRPCSCCPWRPPAPPGPGLAMTQAPCRSPAPPPPRCSLPKVRAAALHSTAHLACHRPVFVAPLLPLQETISAALWTWRPCCPPSISPRLSCPAPWRPGTPPPPPARRPARCAVALGACVGLEAVLALVLPPDVLPCCLPFPQAQDLRGKVALITGGESAPPAVLAAALLTHSQRLPPPPSSAGSTGIGRGAADRLVKAGMRVVATSRTPQDFTQDCPNGTYQNPGDRCRPGAPGACAACCIDRGLAGVTGGLGCRPAWPCRPVRAPQEAACAQPQPRQPNALESQEEVAPAP